MYISVHAKVTSKTFMTWQNGAKDFSMFCSAMKTIIAPLLGHMTYMGPFTDALYIGEEILFWKFLKLFSVALKLF